MKKLATKADAALFEQAPAEAAPKVPLAVRGAGLVRPRYPILPNPIPTAQRAAGCARRPGAPTLRGPWREDARVRLPLSTLRVITWQLEERLASTVVSEQPSQQTRARDA